MDYKNLAAYSFSINECFIGDDSCVLIHPKDFDVEWNRDLLNYRSVIIRKSDGLPISCGFPKFFNYGEKPGLYVNPDNFDDWIIQEKLDGSLIIISIHNEEPIIRTRGCIDALKLGSGDELKCLIDNNPLILNNKWIKSGYTLLFEHLSIKNRIVLKHEASKLMFIGAIRNKDYYNVAANSAQFLEISAGIKCEIPRIFNFSSIRDILENCKKLRGMEGYVLNYNNGQNRIKLKGDEYLRMHRLFSNFRSINAVIEVFFSFNKPATFDDFYKCVSSHIDFEVAKSIKPEMIRVINSYSKITKKILEIREKVLTFGTTDRKSCALNINAIYKDRDKSIAFMCLSNKEIPEKILFELVAENI